MPEDLSESAAVCESAARADDTDARVEPQVTAMTSGNTTAYPLLPRSHVHTIRRLREDVSTRKMHALELDDLLRSERPMYLPIGSRRRTRRMRCYRFRPIDRTVAVTQVAEPEKRPEMTTVKIERVQRSARQLPITSMLIVITVLLGLWFLS